MALTIDGLKRELRRVEEAIAQLTAEDAFMEDVISFHAYRKTLIAALANRTGRRGDATGSLDLWRKRAMGPGRPNAIATEADRARALAAGLPSRSPVDADAEAMHSREDRRK